MEKKYALPSVLLVVLALGLVILPGKMIPGRLIQTYC